MKRLAWLALVAACTEPVEPRPSRIVGATVIAVAIDPPEARPGAPFTATVTVVAPEGTKDAHGATWSLCVGPRPPTDNGTVSPRCLGDTESVAMFGSGATASGNLSTDACARFGPDPPPGGFRPRDPDPSGGYYQPVRVVLGDVSAFGMARLLCHLANAPLAASQRYDAEYVANQAPVIDAFTTSTPTIHAGDAIGLDVRWPDNTREPFVRYDVATEQVGLSDERLVVSWYATDGDLDADRTIGDDHGASVSWTAPETAGTVHLWAVLRDIRGGVAVASLDVDVLQ